MRLHEMKNVRAPITVASSPLPPNSHSTSRHSNVSCVYVKIKTTTTHSVTRVSIRDHSLEALCTGSCKNIRAIHISMMFCIGRIGSPHIWFSPSVLSETCCDFPVSIGHRYTFNYADKLPILPQFLTLFFTSIFETFT